MNTVIDIVLPIFGLIGLGFVIAWTKILSKNTGEALGDFVFVVAIPMLIFRTLALAELPPVSPWPLWLSYFFGIAFVWLIADLIIRRIFGRDRKAAVIAGFAAGFSNLVLIGVPLVHMAFGDAGTVPLFVLISVHLPVMMVVGTVLIERADGGSVGFVDQAKRLAKNIAFNPLIIAIVAGGLWRVLGFPVSGLPKVIIDQIAATASPCALLALGMALRRYGIGGAILPAILLSGLKVFAMPLVVWLAATTFTDLPPLWIAVATVAAASPSGANAYLLAHRFNTSHALSSSTITITTAASMITIAIWLSVLGVGG